MEASAFSFVAEILLGSPITYVGFFLAVTIPMVFRSMLERNLDWFFWPLALLLNLPSLHLLYLASSQPGSWMDGNLDHPVNAPSAAIIETLLIFLWGTGGAGLGLVLTLLVPRSIVRPIGDAVVAIFTPDFWKARRPD